MDFLSTSCRIAAHESSLPEGFNQTAECGILSYQAGYFQARSVSSAYLEISVCQMMRVKKGKCLQQISGITSNFLNRQACEVSALVTVVMVAFDDIVDRGSQSLEHHG